MEREKKNKGKGGKEKRKKEEKEKKEKKKKRKKKKETFCHFDQRFIDSHAITDHRHNLLERNTLLSSFFWFFPVFVLF